MRPRSWWLWAFADGDDNTAVQLLLNGSDALNNHIWQAAPIIYADQNETGGDLAYVFNGRLSLLASRKLDTVHPSGVLKSLSGRRFSKEGDYPFF